MYTINKREDGVLIIKNKRGSNSTKLRLKKYTESGNVFMSINHYKNGENIGEMIMSLPQDVRAQLKEWL